MNTGQTAVRQAFVTLVMGSLMALGPRPLPAQSPPLAGILTRPGQDVVIRGGWLFTGVSDARVRNTGILVRNGKLMEVGADLRGRAFPAAYVIDLDDGATILPGLFDMHAHYNMSLAGGGRVDETVYNPILWLANGVTSTFPAGEYDPAPMQLARERIDAGQQIGPRIFSSGPYFADHRPGWPENPTEQWMRDDVDYWVSRGVQGFKEEALPANLLAALIDQAHKHGVTVTAHLHNYEEQPQPVYVEDAIRMGLDRVEHTMIVPDSIVRGRSGPETAEFEEIARLFIRHNVYYDITISIHCRSTMAEQGVDLEWVDEIKFFTPFMQERIRPRNRWGGRPQYPAMCRHKAPALKRFYEMGGGHLITTGTDRPTSGPHLGGFELQRELQTMVWAGLPPVAALRASTLNSARALGVGDRLGSLEVGKLADLFIVDGNPLEEIRHARNVRLVMKSGQVYDPQLLLRSVEGKIGPAGPADLPKWRRPESGGGN